MISLREKYANSSQSGVLLLILVFFVLGLSSRFTASLCCNDDWLPAPHGFGFQDGEHVIDN